VVHYRDTALVRGYIVSAQTGGLEPVMFAVVSMLHK